jgi:hypothetical protein
METKEGAKGIRKAVTQIFPLLSDDAEFAHVGRHKGSHALNGFSVAAPKCSAMPRQK